MVVGHLGIKYLILILLIFDIRNITHSSKQFRGGHSEYESSTSEFFSLPLNIKHWKEDLVSLSTAWAASGSAWKLNSAHSDTFPIPCSMIDIYSCCWDIGWGFSGDRGGGIRKNTDPFPIRYVKCERFWFCWDVRWGFGLVGGILHIKEKELRHVPDILKCEGS